RSVYSHILSGVPRFPQGAIEYVLQSLQERKNSRTGDQEKQRDQGDEDIRQIRVDAARLNGSHPGGEPQDEVLKRSIKAFLKRRLDLALEMDFLRIVGVHVEDCLNLTARLVQCREDHPPCL